jgi:hypothetical protein
VKRLPSPLFDTPFPGQSEMNSAKLPKCGASLTRILSVIGKFLASMFIVEDADLVAYDVAGHEIAYSLLFTLYGYV